VLEKDLTIEKFLAKIRSKNTFAYIVFLNDKPIAYIQYYHIDRTIDKAGSWLPPELPTTTVGTDQFIGDPAYVGKGYGTLFIKEFIDYLTHTLEPNITTIILDPDPANYAAIRCYEKVGFKSMGTYTTPGGHPALLMRYDVKK
jgi:RimJ/RimL family protein N-acetyltransferase